MSDNKPTGEPGFFTMVAILIVLFASTAWNGFCDWLKVIWWGKKK